MQAKHTDYCHWSAGPCGWHVCACWWCREKWTLHGG
jgi:hypothetical protein